MRRKSAEAKTKAQLNCLVNAHLLMRLNYKSSGLCKKLDDFFTFCSFWKNTSEFLMVIAHTRHSSEKIIKHVNEISTLNRLAMRAAVLRFDFVKIHEY